MSELVSPENAGILGAAWALRRVLGPSLVALGGSFGDYTEYRLRNLRKIDEKVGKRLGDESEDGDRAVHPRVARAVLDEGSWIDDDLHQEYLAALLVNARTSGGDSDAAAYNARLVSSMTASQVQLHYAIYRAYAGYWPDDSPTSPMPWSSKDAFRAHSVVVTKAELTSLFPEAPWQGLEREGLIKEAGTPQNPGPDHYAFIPSLFGAHLFLSTFSTVHPTTSLDILCLSDERRRGLVEGGQLKVDLALPTDEPSRFQTAQVLNAGG